MHRCLFIISLLLLPGACANPPPAFTAMSEQEILAYNEDRPVIEQVYCVRLAELSSHIRKRRCKTIGQWLDMNARAVMTLEVLNAGNQPFFSSGFIDDGRRN